MATGKIWKDSEGLDIYSSNPLENVPVNQSSSIMNLLNLQDSNNSDNKVDDPTTDEWYLNFINQYKDTEIYEELLNNPYLLGRNAPYSETLGDKLAWTFGGSTAGQDRYYAELLSNRNKVLFDLIGRYKQNQRNSPLSQVQQNAAAGINSDLVGTGNVQPSAENDSLAPTSEGMPEVGNQFEPIMEIANIGANIFSGIFNMASQIQGFQMQQLELDSKELVNSKSFSDLASQFVSDSLPDIFTPVGTIKSDVSDDDVMQYFLQSVRSISDDETIPKRIRSRFAKWVNHITNTDESDRHTFKFSIMRKELENAWLKAHKESADYRSEHGFNLDVVKYIEKLSQDIKEPLNKVNKAIQDFQAAQANFESDYYKYKFGGKSLGQKKAEADFSKYGFDRDYFSVRLDGIGLGRIKGQSEGYTWNYKKTFQQNVITLRSQINSAFNDISEKLSHSDNPFAPFGMAILPSARAASNIAIMKLTYDIK